MTNHRSCIPGFVTCECGCKDVQCKWEDVVCCLKCNKPVKLAPETATMSTSKPMQDFLKAAGLGVDLARRVIIDMQVDEPVRVYIERFGSQKVFDVQTPDLRFAEVTVLDAEKKPDATVDAN